MTLFDTPCFNNTPMGETEATAGICDQTLLNHRERRLLSGFIYLHRTTNFLMSNSSLKSLWHRDVRWALSVGVLLLKHSIASDIDLNYKRTNFYNDFLLGKQKAWLKLLRKISKPRTLGNTRMRLAHHPVSQSAGSAPTIAPKWTI